MIASVQALGEYGGLTAITVAKETAGQLGDFVFDHWLALGLGLFLVVAVWKLVDA
ncbi:MAG: hypothetical protein ABFS34_07795 [Gemmatimonadota bacterium]